jgi:septum formation protein
MVLAEASLPPTPTGLILASASPRRRELLSQLGLPFRIIPADIDESVWPGEAPWAYVRRVAYAKAQHVARQHPAALVLGADSVVVLGQQILGKPRDEAQARDMLTQLSGRMHRVQTVLALVHAARHLVCLEGVSTVVRFRELSATEITGYIATGEPMDKAGAYAIQGIGRAFVASWDGCYTSAVGLPLQRTAALLRALGWTITSVPAHSAQSAS